MSATFEMPPIIWGAIWDEFGSVKNARTCRTRLPLRPAPRHTEAQLVVALTFGMPLIHAARALEALRLIRQPMKRRRGRSYSKSAKRRLCDRHFVAREIAESLPLSPTGRWRAEPNLQQSLFRMHFA